MEVDGYDFSGFATKYNVKCSDGRTILPGAFKHLDGKKVPLLWNHRKEDPDNVLGHCVLEARNDSIYAYAFFNDTAKAKNAKIQVQHGDLNALSIYANSLDQDSKRNVHHGEIREVSLVLAGANPGAFIENIIRHGEIMDDEAIIYLDSEDAEFEFEHEDEADENVIDEEEYEENDLDNVTGWQIYETMTDLQKAYFESAVAEALHTNISDDSDEAEQSDKETGEELMHVNVFENDGVQAVKPISEQDKNALLHDALEDMKAGKTFKDAIIAHAGTYGIDNIELLFPDAKAITNTPEFISRRMDWIPKLMDRIRKQPWTRIKMLQADITADEARAKGYVKGTRKTEEVFNLLSRTTEPQTIYKKQKLDRDDILDIKDLDVVAWLWAEMRIMLEEEIARAILVGDGRPVTLVDGKANPDKIKEDKIRPIYKEDELYAIRLRLPNATSPQQLIEGIIRSRRDYRGTGSPVLFMHPDVLTDLLLIKDKMDRYVYPTIEELKTRLRVSDIVETEFIDATLHDDEGVFNLKGILVNPVDYTVGTDAGGEITRFNQFDIDYNQEKYLLETRMSGALTKVRSAIVIETLAAPIIEP